MKIATIVGARPQFIKAASVSRSIAEHNKSTSRCSHISQVVIHTGQHFDANMSAVFFQELEIPKPDFFLDIHGLSHGAMTGQMMEKIEEALISEKPDLILVYGDTNSTLAGALASVKLHIPVAHVEAGLRSFNRKMPEEINRVITDHVSSLLFCPTDTAVENLKSEGIKAGIYKTGDVMYDAFLYYKKLSETKSSILRHLNLTKKKYYLATVHRESNTDNPKILTDLLKAFNAIATPKCPMVIPLHPRTRKVVELIINFNIEESKLKIIPPVSYLDMIALEINAKIILTDSGGVQKEAYFARVPCITLREETEWVETIATHWNYLAGVDTNQIIDICKSVENVLFQEHPSLYGNGSAGSNIVAQIFDYCNSVNI